MTGREMKVARINRGFSIRALGRAIDIHEASIRRLEGEVGPIALDSAKKLADWHGVRVIDLPCHAVEDVAA